MSVVNLIWANAEFFVGDAPDIKADDEPNMAGTFVVVVACVEVCGHTESSNIILCCLI